MLLRQYFTEKLTEVDVDGFLTIHTSYIITRFGWPLGELLFLHLSHGSQEHKSHSPPNKSVSILHFFSVYSTSTQKTLVEISEMVFILAINLPLTSADYGHLKYPYFWTIFQIFSKPQKHLCVHFYVNWNTLHLFL